MDGIFSTAGGVGFMMKMRIFLLIVCLLFIGAVPIVAQNAPANPDEEITVAYDLYERGLAALDAGDFDRAALDISLFILLNPTFAPAYSARAYAAINTEDFDSAIADLTQAIDLSPVEIYTPEFIAGLYTQRGRLFVGRNDDDAALADFVAAIDLAPTAENFATRAGFFTLTGDLEAAIADYNAAIDLDPSPQNIVTRSRLLAEAGDYEAALADLDTILADFPDDASLALLRAGVLDRMGEQETAAGEYLRYIRLINTNQVENDDLLVANEPVTVEIGEGTVHVFAFEGQTGQVVTISSRAHPDDQLDTLLLLLDPEGNPLAGSDDFEPPGLDSQITRFTLNSSGYYLVVLTHALGGSEGRATVGYVVHGAGS
jgi:tetratricopeptide (TPR) repeat protein